MSNDLSDATLFQLVNAFVAAVVDGEGDWTASVEALDRAIDGKVERYQRAAHFIRGKRAAIMGEASYYKSLADAYVQRAKALQAHDDRMEQALLKMMHETGKTNIDTPLGSLKLKKVPHIELRGDAAVIFANLPELYMRRPDPEVDKKRLLNDYRAFVKALIEHGADEETAITGAKLKMPICVEVVYNESVGGY